MYNNQVQDGDWQWKEDEWETLDDDWNWSQDDFEGDVQIMESGTTGYSDWQKDAVADTEQVEESEEFGTSSQWCQTVVPGFQSTEVMEAPAWILNMEEHEGPLEEEVLVLPDTA